MIELQSFEINTENFNHENFVLVEIQIKVDMGRYVLNIQRMVGRKFLLKGQLWCESCKIAPSN
jgi:hypothetical protein